jgi:hypothetical protein
MSLFVADRGNQHSPAAGLPVLQFGTGPADGKGLIQRQMPAAIGGCDFTCGMSETNIGVQSVGGKHPDQTGLQGEVDWLRDTAPPQSAGIFAFGHRVYERETGHRMKSGVELF